MLPLQHFMLSLSLFFPGSTFVAVSSVLAERSSLYFQVSLPSPYKHCIDSFSILPTARKYIFFFCISLKKYIFSHHKNIAYSLKKVLKKIQKTKNSKKIQLCIILQSRVNYILMSLSPNKMTIMLYILFCNLIFFCLKFKINIPC